MTEGISKATFISSITNLSVPTSATDLLSYVEMLLVQDYDEQMRDMAQSIKTNTALKKAYRDRKNEINKFLNRKQDGTKVELTEEEFKLLNDDPDLKWDPDLYDGMGGVRDYNNKSDNIFAISNKNYQEVETFGKELIATNEQVEWFGDPHINDPDGKKRSDWDFQGKAGDTYEYFNDSNLHMTATHQAGQGGTTVVGSVGFRLSGPQKDSLIFFDAKKQPLLDNQEMKKNVTYDLQDRGQARWDGKTLQVTTAEGYVFNIEDKGSYLDGNIRTSGKGVASDGRAPTGVLGQTFDADSQAKFASNQESENSNKGFNVTNKNTNPNGEKQPYKVEVERIKAKLEGLQMKIDNLNSETELEQTELSTVTSQRKLAFESLSSMIAKVFEGSSSIVRNIK